MRSSDRKMFGDVMRDAREAIGQGEPYTEGALDLMFAALAEFSMSTIQQALVDHISSKDGRWRPNASYISEQIRARTDAQWISADEAWARIAPQKRPMLRLANGKPDHRSTEPRPALLNQVSAEALAAAQSLLDAGEDTAARMAFRAAYDRLVERAKVAPKPEDRIPQYFVSGGSHEERLAVRDEAVRMGLLPAPPAPAPQQMLASPACSNSKPDLAALLETLKPKALPPPESVDYE